MWAFVLLWMNEDKEAAHEVLGYLWSVKKVNRECEGFVKMRWGLFREWLGTQWVFGVVIWALCFSLFSILSLWVCVCACVGAFTRPHQATRHLQGQKSRGQDRACLLQLIIWQTISSPLTTDRGKRIMGNMQGSFHHVGNKEGKSSNLLFSPCWGKTLETHRIMLIFCNVISKCSCHGQY